jgi:hypothetical protein
MRLEIGFVHMAILLFRYCWLLRRQTADETAPAVTILSTDLLFAFLALMGGGL